MATKSTRRYQRAFTRDSARKKYHQNRRHGGKGLKSNWRGRGIRKSSRSAFKKQR